MSDLTPVLGLIRQYLEDYGDKRIDNINWDKLDKLFHAIYGHKHDGVDSPLIDLDALWRAIYELRRITTQLRIDLTELDIREALHYNEYIKHKHYALDAPPSIETHWFDTFKNYNQINLALSNVAISSAVGAMHLPYNYEPNNPYLFVSKSFRLAHTLVENPNPDIQPDQAYARIVMEREGIVTPYIAISNNLIPDNTNALIYPGALAGEQTRISFLDNYVKSKISFEGKVNNNFTVPHIAWHYYEAEMPIIKKRRKRKVVVTGRHRRGKRVHKDKDIKNRYRIDVNGYTDRLEFSTDQYDKLTVSDGDTVTTGDYFSTTHPVIEDSNLSQSFRVLYPSNTRALAWQKEGKKYFWYDFTTQTLEEIPHSKIEPLIEDHMYNVAAALDPDDGYIWILKSWAKMLEKPRGFFDSYHQLVRWDGEDEFIEGRKWRARRHRRKHWPVNLISPTRLKVDSNNVYPITSFDFNELKDEGESLVNYYDGDENSRDAHDDYTWFPFKKIYGDIYKERSNVTFSYFNPGLLGTIHSIPKEGDWVAVGSAQIINGRYNPTANKWSLYDEEQINAYEGGNDSVYLGESGQELFFYQSFNPYDTYDIVTNKSYEDEEFRENNPDYSWHGIVAYNIATGENRYIEGNIPNKINAGGTITTEGGEVYLMGGLELVKQFYTVDNRIIATEDNIAPTGTEIKYAFWADRNYPGVVTADRLNLRDEINNPVKINLSTGVSERIQTASDSNSSETNERTYSPKALWHSSGFTLLSGYKVRGRRSQRSRHRDRRITIARKWKGSISDGGKARQIYNFDLGNELEYGDKLTLYVQSESEGKISTDITSGSVQDVEIYAYAEPDWVKISGISNGDGLTAIEIQDEGLFDLGEITIMLESSRIADRPSGTSSLLHTDHAYLAITKQNYVFEYEWEDLPDGNNAVIILQCTGGTDASGNEDLGDIAGVWVDSAEFSIIANLEG